MDARPPLVRVAVMRYVVPAAAENDATSGFVMLGMVHSTPVGVTGFVRNVVAGPVPYSFCARTLTE